MIAKIQPLSVHPHRVPKKSLCGHLIVSAGRASCASLPRRGRHEFRRFAPYSALCGNVLSVRSSRNNTNAVLNTPVAEDGLRVHSRAQQSVLCAISTAVRRLSILIPYPPVPVISSFLRGFVLSESEHEAWPTHQGEMGRIDGLVKDKQKHCLVCSGTIVRQGILTGGMMLPTSAWT